MRKKVMNLTFTSSLTDLCAVNSSFDSGILRIAYWGDNNNRSHISKEVFERCIPTMYNCPIACNYERETDSLGGHDVDLVRGENGVLRMVNITEPIGVVPTGARHFWEVVEEDDGTEHEYLCVEVLIWKRQEAYQKIKRDGVVAQSMEITVKEGRRIDGIYHVEDFEFTAFVLIGVTPCFESASLTFAAQEFKNQLSEMMFELKESLSNIDSTQDGSDINDYSMKGGEGRLEKKELIERYNIDIDALDFSIDDFSAEELEEKFKAMTEAKNSEGNEADDSKTAENFALTQNVVEEILASLSSQKVQREWGECNRYSYVDCDLEANEVYCWDTDDWLLYGFTFEKDGDKVNINFDSKTRKKYTIVDFDEGEQTSPFAEAYSKLTQVVQNNATAYTDLTEKYNEAVNEAEYMKSELDELRKFKLDSETNAAIAERTSQNEEVFSQFEDLAGVEKFEDLKAECGEDCMKYSLEDLEEKCFAIRGRQGTQLKFSGQQKATKIKVEKDEQKEALPYNGVFEKYGFSLND